MITSAVIGAFEAMFRSGRLPHSFLLYGEKGLGKKHAALHMAQALLCEKNTGVPCGGCMGCKKAAAGVHPDLIFPEKSGKLGTYSVDVCRHVRSDSYVKPNDGERKVYIFSDCTEIQAPAQNAMLKIIEEPPEYAYFIFTAESKNLFLPTALSRIISLPAAPFTKNECIEILREKGYEDPQIKEAMENFGRNPGMCIEYLENESLRNISLLTKKAADAIINKSEYGFLTAVSDPQLKDRTSARTFLKMLDNIVRDSVVLKINDSAETEGCSRRIAQALSGAVSSAAAMKLHDLITSAADDISMNVNASLVFAGLCGETAAL